MGRWMFKIVASVVILVFVFGCAGPSNMLSGKDKLEAKDWLHAGDLSYQIKDWDTAQYYYDLVVKKYPDSWYGKKAKENLSYIDYQRGIGGAVRAATDALEPIF